MQHLPRAWAAQGARAEGLMAAGEMVPTSLVLGEWGRLPHGSACVSAAAGLLHACEQPPPVCARLSSHWPRPACHTAPPAAPAELLVNAMTESGMTRFLVDGFPRTVDQLREFEEKIQPADFVLVFTVPEEVAVERLVARGADSGRADDNEETIRSRMQVRAARQRHAGRACGASALPARGWCACALRVPAACWRRQRRRECHGARPYITPAVSRI